MPAIILDVFERPELETLLSGHGLTVVRQNLVPLGLGDFMWVGHGGTRFSIEHKQARELVDTMGGRLDDQLRKHSQNADVVGLAIEGIVSPKEGGGCEFWQLSRNGKYYHKIGKSQVGYEALQAYIWSISQQGIYVFSFPSLDAMALGLASFIFNSMKDSHKALTSYTRSHPISLPETGAKETYIRTLMGLWKATIGETTARKVLDAYPTPWDFFLAGADAFDKVGREVTIKAMRSIGRSSI